MSKLSRFSKRSRVSQSVPPLGQKDPSPKGSQEESKKQESEEKKKENEGEGKGDGESEKSKKHTQRVPIILYIKGRNLKRMDPGVGKSSDPQCQIYQDTYAVGRTEIIFNNLDPDFQEAIQMDYFFHRDQQLEVRFVDNDDQEDKFAKAEGEMIGSVIVGLP